MKWSEEVAAKVSELGRRGFSGEDIYIVTQRRVGGQNVPSCQLAKVHGIDIVSMMMRTIKVTALFPNGGSRVVELDRVYFDKVEAYRQAINEIVEGVNRAQKVVKEAYQEALNDLMASIYDQ